MAFYKLAANKGKGREFTACRVGGAIAEGPGMVTSGCIMGINGGIPRIGNAHLHRSMWS